MLPTSKPTERLLHLQSLLDNAMAETFAQWPGPTKDDCALIGGYIVIFSYLDLNLRRIVEILELAGKLPKPTKGGVANLTITDVETLILSTDMKDSHRIAFENIQTYRGMRNLVAHFALKRFPDDDAFVFMTKSARDYKREFKRDAPPGVLFTGLVEVQPIRDAMPHLERLQVWLQQATNELEELLLSHKSTGSRGRR